MATVGSVAGGFVTYRLACKGGKETLARRFPPKTLDKVYKRFERWGLGAIAIPALLPPPVPMLPFLFGAGAMQYPVRKFLFALSVGRVVRSRFWHSSQRGMDEKYSFSSRKTGIQFYSLLSS